MKLLMGLAMLAGLLWLERSLTKQASPQDFARCDWWSHHPNGGGV